MTDVPCALCQKPLGDSIRSGYTPYATHADKRICVANIRADEREKIMARVKQDMSVDREKWTVMAQSVSAEQIRADERERIAQAIEKPGARHRRFSHALGGDVVLLVDAARIARNGGRDE